VYNRPRPHWFLDVFSEAYAAELTHFTAFLRGQAAADASLDDARAALVLALAAIRSVEEHRPVSLDEVRA
jgi:myo-inositol 2-dehydrogenase/D-chiro-inositol 1-dehydrogenase